VHPHDADAAGIGEGEEAVLESKNGAVSGVVRYDAGVGIGSVSVPHGYSSPRMSHLMSGATDFDPLTGMVLQSGVPVKLRSVEVPAF